MNPSNRTSPAADTGTGTAVVASGWLAANSMFGSDDRRTKRAFGASFATFLLHGLFLLVATWAITYQAQTILSQTPMPITHLVFRQEVGPGGGGGGSPAPAPPKALSVPKTTAPDPIPVVPPPDVTPPPPTPTLVAPILTTNSAAIQATGTSSVSLSALGGGGKGDGVGPGSGPGVGPGHDGGFGGDAFRPGAGISDPVPVRRSTPVYTPEAMRNKVQGSVEVEAVVLEDGTVGDVRIRKSLDRVSGMDQEALRAAKQWFFTPARDREGHAVKIVVILGFDLRLH